MSVTHIAGDARTSPVDRIQDHCAALWHCERALVALGRLAATDGYLNVNRRQPTLSMLEAQDFGCLMDLLADHLRLYTGLIKDETGSLDELTQESAR